MQMECKMGSLGESGAAACTSKIWAGELRFRHRLLHVRGRAPGFARAETFFGRFPCYRSVPTQERLLSAPLQCSHKKKSRKKKKPVNEKKKLSSDDAGRQAPAAPALQNALREWKSFGDSLPLLRWFPGACGAPLRNVQGVSRQSGELPVIAEGWSAGSAEQPAREPELRQGGVAGREAALSQTAVKDMQMAPKRPKKPKKKDPCCWDTEKGDGRGANRGMDRWFVPFCGKGQW
ncbi:hypothetical protein HDV62DRAFT_211806 [Trichoderma sp. SZMC 28011]